MPLQPDSSYLSGYRSHLTDTQAHLLGIPTTDDGDDDDDDGQTNDPSLVWSPEEKSRLFHALAVHSRWRLDLVTVCVHTKSIVDVSLYVECLRQAAAALDAGTWKPENESENDVENENDNQDADSDVAEERESSLNMSLAATAAARRRALPCAMMMPRTWVRWEEKQANLLAYVEPLWEAAAVHRARQAEVETEAGGDISREERWEHEDTFARLGERHLRVIDSVIREAEERTVGRKRKREEEDEDEDVDEDDETSDANTPDLTLLSPQARRRYQKRLYMRRKRASMTGTAVVEKLARLKPGRQFRPRAERLKELKEKKRRKERGCVSESEDGSKEDDIARQPTDEHSTDDSDPPVRLPNEGGISTSHRIRCEFIRMGDKGDVLRKQGYGLLHMGGIARAMRAQSECMLFINAATIRLLDACVTGYIRELIGRVIMLRAEEVRQKGGSKAWHNSFCEIRPRDVSAVIEEWEVERHTFTETNREGEETEEELEDIDSEAEAQELEEEESLDMQDRAEEERYVGRLWAEPES